MSNVVIWHNPRCSKSRQTLALIEENGIAPKVRRYLEDAPNADELRTALIALGLPARQIIRTGEAAYKALNLGPQPSEDSLIAAMAANPKLIERPIVFAADGARIGRPPESVLELF